jgi:hypothetical protein
VGDIDCPACGVVNGIRYPHPRRIDDGRIDSHGPHAIHASSFHSTSNYHRVPQFVRRRNCRRNTHAPHEARYRPALSIDPAHYGYAAPSLV